MMYGSRQVYGWNKQYHETVTDEGGMFPECQVVGTHPLISLA